MHMQLTKIAQALAAVPDHHLLIEGIPIRWGRTSITGPSLSPVPNRFKRFSLPEGLRQNGWKSKGMGKANPSRIMTRLPVGPKIAGLRSCWCRQTSDGSSR